MNFIHQNLYWILPLVAIDGVLKSIALWKAARHNQLMWFVILVILNSAGVLPIVYILFFQKTTKSK